MRKVCSYQAIKDQNPSLAQSLAALENSFRCSAIIGMIQDYGIDFRAKGTVDRHLDKQCSCEPLKPLFECEIPLMFFDYETLPGKTSNIDIWGRDGVMNRYLRRGDVKQLKEIFLFSYRFYGESKTHTLALWDFESKEAYAEAIYEVHAKLGVSGKRVAHNGFRAEEPWSNNLFWKQNKLAPLPKTQMIDTLRMARSLWPTNESFNALDDLLVDLSLGQKSGRYDVEKARAAMAGDRASQRELIRYCEGDVEPLIQLFEYMAPRVKQKIVLNPRAAAMGFCHLCGGRESTVVDTIIAGAKEYDFLQCDVCSTFRRAKVGAKIV